METHYTNGLKIRVDGIVEEVPNQFRQAFRQAVVDTVVRLVRTRDIEVEYVLYKPGETPLLPNLVCDRVFLSFAINNKVMNHFKQFGSGNIVDAFAEVFESVAHRPLCLSDSNERGAAFTSRWTQMTA